MRREPLGSLPDLERGVRDPQVDRGADRTEGRGIEVAPIAHVAVLLDLAPTDPLARLVWDCGQRAKEIGLLLHEALEQRIDSIIQSIRSTQCETNPFVDAKHIQNSDPTATKYMLSPHR